MKTRAETIRFIEAQFQKDGDAYRQAKNGRYHYGQVELRALLDFVFEGPPADEGERLQIDTYKQR